MKRLVLVVAAGLAAISLAGCDPTDEERARAASMLPAGCELLNIGSYGDLRSLIVVHCRGVETTSSNFSWTQGAGKTATTAQGTAIVVGDPA